MLSSFEESVKKNFAKLQIAYLEKFVSVFIRSVLGHDCVRSLERAFFNANLHAFMEPTS